jgi:hypothetical protein
MYHASLAFAFGTLLLLGGGGVVQAQGLDRPLVQPNPFPVPPLSRPPSGLDEQKAILQRNLLRDRLRTQEMNDIGQSALGAEELRNTRRDLSQAERYLNAPPSPLVAPGGLIPQRPLSSGAPLEEPLGSGGPPPRKPRTAEPAGRREEGRDTDAKRNPTSYRNTSPAQLDELARISQHLLQGTAPEVPPKGGR